MKLAFLVYDSRSGSTLLASMLSKSITNMCITPEIGFGKLLTLRDDELCEISEERLMKILNYRQNLRNWPGRMEDVKSLLYSLRVRDSSEFTRAGIIQALLEPYHKGIITTEEGACLMVKCGEHIKYWREIVGVFPDADIICIVRDPRVVVNSKLHTLRPYHPWETMGWPGAFLLAHRWKSIFHQVEAAQGKLRVFKVCYEEFVVRPDAVIKDLAEFFGCVIAGKKKGREYEIPEDEKRIHSLVFRGVPERNRADAWRRTLGWLNRVIVETVTRKTMEQMNYSDDVLRIPKAGRLLIWFVGSCLSGAAVLKHFGQLWWHRFMRLAR